MKLRLITRTGIRKYNVRKKSNYYFNERIKAFEKIDAEKTYTVRMQGREELILGERLKYGIFKRTRSGEYVRDKKRVDIPVRITKDMELKQHQILYAQATTVYNGKRYKLEGWSYLVRKEDGTKSFRAAVAEARIALIKNLAWQSQSRNAYNHPAKLIKITKVKVSYVIS
jgi:hypothetical protein